jgi:hypothetical protein
VCVHAAISDEFCVGAQCARDGKGRRATDGVQAEFGIAKSSKCFCHSYFRNVSAHERGNGKEGVGGGGGFVSSTCGHFAKIT